MAGQIVAWAHALLPAPRPAVSDYDLAYQNAMKRSSSGEPRPAGWAPRRKGHVVTADPGLIERSADLKRALLDFQKDPPFDAEFRREIEARFGKIVRADEGELGNFFDWFILQHRLEDGRTVVDHFVEAHPELAEAERAMLLGWKDVVEGLFEYRGQDGGAALLENLVDDLTYRVHSNVGPRVFAQFARGAFLVARLVPVSDEWLVSGYLSTFPPSRRTEVYRLAAQLALEQPALVFRNPEKLAQGWELQRAERERFIEFFGADLVVVPGRELAERMRAYMHYRQFEARDAEGKTAADRSRDAYGVEATPIEQEFPSDLLEAETVGVICDEVDGLNFLRDFGLVAAVFADPKLAKQQPYRECVYTYLEDSTISPRVLLRQAERDPERATRVFREILRQRDFSWERDGEALVRQYKRSYYEHPVLPGASPVSEKLARAQLTAAQAGPALPGGRRPGRNDPCSCGSGKKYKRCHGR
jgi:hypothetical protein